MYIFCVCTIEVLNGQSFLICHNSSSLLLFLKTFRTKKYQQDLSERMFFVINFCFFFFKFTDSSIPSRPRRVFEENMTRLQEVTNGSSNEQASYMSLDVLAQVATDKLRDDLKLQPKVTPKKVCLF